MIDDPIVAEVRAVRESLSRRLNYDVHAIFEDMRSREKRQGPRLVAPLQTSVDAHQALSATSTRTPGR